MSVNTRTTVVCACTHIPLWCTTAAILTRKYTNSAVVYIFLNIKQKGKVMTTVGQHPSKDSKMLISSSRNLFALIKKSRVASTGLLCQSCTNRYLANSTSVAVKWTSLGLDSAVLGAFETSCRPCCIFFIFGFWVASQLESIPQLASCVKAKKEKRKKEASTTPNNP